MNFQSVLALHFDPVNGSRYWLRREQELGISVQDAIQDENDLWKLGPMKLEDLASYPVEDFIPQRFLNEKRKFILAETGGATGRPKTTAYFEDEFQKIFVESFTSIALSLGLTGRGRWLWIGPGGPHAIGKAANLISKQLSHADAFSIDFDPRWYRKLAPESLGRKRYMEHILDQILTVWNTQHIENLFATPVVLESIISRLNTVQRERIRGIYLGGMAVKPEILNKLIEAFPNAVIISGYGNTLFGVCHDFRDLSKGIESISYFPHQDRVILRVIPVDESLPDHDRLRYQVDSGERGQVVFHRLDESYFLPNVIERDCAVRVSILDFTNKPECERDGIGDPMPLIQKQFKVEEGIY